MKGGVMKRWKRLLTNLLLLPVFGIMAAEGDGGGDGGDGGSILGGDTGGGGTTGGDGGNQSDDLSGLFTAEEITAKRESVAAAKAEEERRAALTEEERTAEDTQKAAEAEKNKIPEEYADFTLPDGMQMDAELLEDFKPLAKELGLSQEKAQKLVDLQAKAMQKMHTDRLAEYEGLKAQWAKDTKADKEIGGDKGDQYDSNVEIAQRAMNTFATPELKQLLNEYGLGNHPELVRLMVRIGKGMKEDGIVMPGAGGSGEKKTVGDRLYGGQK